MTMDSPWRMGEEGASISPEFGGDTIVLSEKDFVGSSESQDWIRRISASEKVKRRSSFLIVNMVEIKVGLASNEGGDCIILIVNQKKTGVGDQKIVLT